MKDKIIVSGTGCCLLDLLYNHIDFTGREIGAFLSRERGDGGLSPGRLVLLEEFEQYAGIKLEQFIQTAAGKQQCDEINIGGPSIVSLIHAAQMTGTENCEVRFYGKAGNDAYGAYLLESLRKTPVVLRNFQRVDNRTPSTVVLSDPSYDHGHGERMFIHVIGAAGDLHPDDLDEEFFHSDIVVFGGTAIVPRIHDHLASLLRKARSRGCMTIVNTVFDFRSERENPDRRWPLGESDESYALTDLLITDHLEALRLSGETDVNHAIRFFQEKKVRSLMITNGAEEIHTYSDGSFFNSEGVMQFPVSQKIRSEIIDFQGGDTTGCGDNFAGGVIASIVHQKRRGRQKFDLQEACSLGIVSGGFACFHMGGTYFEKIPGEKYRRIKPYHDTYRQQISSR